MELVRGIPITKYCDEHQLTLKQRLELFLPVCLAVQHAHQKGIIHRDLKPTNVLVAQYDDKPVPKVIDFGVAKAAQKLTERTMFTEFGQMVGTLEYMSPEQARLNQLDIDTRSDIYSLGVLLYELLTGCTPFDGKRLRSAAFDEMLRIIREEDPPKPSTRLSAVDTLPSIAASRNVEPARLGRALCGELDWIVMKALEKDRNRRYETANGFANDIQRYLNDEPVQACPPSMSYRFRKLARRNKVALSFAGLVTAATVLGIALLAFSNVRIRTESLAKEQALIEADENFQTARDAVDRMYTRAAEEMRDKPQMEPLRRALLEDALRFYQGFLQRKSEDPAVRYEAALSQRRVGEIYGLLDDWNESLKHHRESTQMLVSLSPQFANDVRYRDEVARSHFHSGRALMALLQLDEGTRSLEEAIALWEALAREFPDKPSYLEDLADANFRLGRGWSHNYHAKGASYVTKSQELLMRLKQTFPDHRINSSLQDGLREIGAWRYAQLPHNPADLRQLERECRDHLALAEAEARKNPEIPRYELAVVTCLNQLSNVLLALDRFEEIEPVSLRSLEIRQRQGRQHPDSPDFQTDLAWAHYHRAWLLQMTDRPDEALLHFRTAISMISDVASKLPNSHRLLAHHAGMLRGCPVPQLRDLQQVLEIRNRIKDLGAEGWGDLAWAQVDAGMYQEALESCRKATLSDRQSPIAAYVTALAYWHLGRQAEARELAQRVVLELGSQPNHYWYQGECRWRARELGKLMGIDVGGLKASDPEKALRSGIALYRKLTAEQPDDPGFQQDLAVRYAELFQLLSAAGRTEEADQIFGDGLNVWKQIPKDHAAHLDQTLQLLDKLINIGHSLHWVRPQESLRILTETLPLARQQLATFPDVRGCREQVVRSGTLLAWIMLDMQQPGDAEKLARQSLESAAQLVKEFPGESQDQLAFALAAKITGQALAANGHGDEAERVLRQGLETLVSVPPGDPAHHRDLFGIRCDLSKLLAQHDSRLQEAADLLRAAITSREKWLVEVADDAGDRSHLGWAYRSLGAVLARQMNRDPEADAACQQDIKIFERLSIELPTDSGCREHLAYARDIWQRRLNDTGRPREAAEALDQALEERRKLAKDFPSVPYYRVQLAELLKSKGRSQQAEEPFREALAVYTQLAQDQPKNLDYQLRLSQTYHELAGLFAQQGKQAEGAIEWGKATAEYSKAIELKPDSAEAWSGRAFTHFGRKEWDAAIADFSKAIELAPMAHTNWWHRGHSYFQLMQWDKAAADFGTAVERWPDQSAGEGWFLQAICRAQLNERETAMGDLRRAIANGFRNVAWMKGDTRLDTLRRREDFGKLLEELEAKEKSRSE